MLRSSAVSSAAPRWWPGGRLGPQAAERVAIGAAALIALVLGWLAVRFDGFEADIGPAVLLTLGALGCMAVVAAGPVACLAAIGALTVGGIRPVLAEPSGLEVTIVDVFYAGLVGWWLLGLIGRAQRARPDPRQRIAFGQSVAIALFVYVALTFFHVANSDPGALDDSIISWLRVVLTASIAFLAASVIETKRDVRIVLGATVAAGAVAIVVGAFNADSLFEGRTGGALGPNALGLVSGLLLLSAAFGAVTAKWRYRIALVVVGAVGLLLAKSVAAFVATGLVLGLAASLAGKASPAQRVTRVALAVALAGLVVVGLVQLLRPEIMPGSEGFKGSSAEQRIILAAAGVEIFERNAVIGVGWRQSSSPEVVGDREIANEVRRRFPDARSVLYPDIRPSSVHNTYVQVLADLGIVGFALFAALLMAIALSATKLLRRLKRSDDLWPEAWTMTFGLLLVAVWLNDNPLFGGQPPMVIAALLVGMLAAIWRICAPGAKGSAE
jgi:O-antigen ligase